jgi:hypothetical protein
MIGLITNLIVSVARASASADHENHCGSSVMISSRTLLSTSTALTYLPRVRAIIALVLIAMSPRPRTWAISREPRPSFLRLWARTIRTALPSNSKSTSVWGRSPGLWRNGRLEFSFLVYTIRENAFSPHANALHELNFSRSWKTSETKVTKRERSVWSPIRSPIPVTNSLRCVGDLAMADGAH